MEDIICDYEAQDTLLTKSLSSFIAVEPLTQLCREYAANDSDALFEHTLLTRVWREMRLTGSYRILFAMYKEEERLKWPVYTRYLSKYSVENQHCSLNYNLMPKVERKCHRRLCFNSLCTCQDPLIPPQDIFTKLPLHPTLFNLHH